MLRITTTGTATLLLFATMGAFRPALAVSQQYQIMDLGTFGGSSGGGAMALNNAGQVVGNAATPEIVDHQSCTCINYSCACSHHYSNLTAGFFWSDGVMTRVTSDEGIVSDLNDAGQAVGWRKTPTADTRAFLWQGTMIDLGTLGGNDSSAWGINSVGQVVGWSETSTGHSHAFLWQGTMVDLGTLGGSVSRANAINDRGVIVGSFDTIDHKSHPFVLAPRDLNSDGVIDTWFLDEDANGANDLMIDLGTLGGTAGLGDGAQDINSTGQVVGKTMTSEGETHAFIVTPLDTNGDGQGDVWYLDGDGNGVNDLMQDLGTVGGNSSAASGINDLGQVVGTSHDRNGFEIACLWDNERITDLTALLPPESYMLLYNASDINNKGQVCGWGYSSINQRTFLLTPVIYHTLTTAASGAGTVDASGEYESGAQVSITATPSEGWHFDHWEGDASGRTNPLQITMDADKNITAVFADGDACPNDPAKIGPGACGCGTPDTDTDSDGTPDCLDPCPADRANQCGDACPRDPNKSAEGICGCGVPDTDSDGNGTPDCMDDTGAPTPAPPVVGLCGAGVAQCALAMGLALMAVQRRRRSF